MCGRWKWRTLIIVLFFLGAMLFFHHMRRKTVPCRMLLHEGYYFHRHVIPSYVYLANSCGIDPDIVTKGRPVRDEDVYQLMKNEELRFTRLHSAPNFSLYDLILRGTYYDTSFPVGGEPFDFVLWRSKVIISQSCSSGCKENRPFSS
jgi:hypothetical protein